MTTEPRPAAETDATPDTDAVPDSPAVPDAAAVDAAWERVLAHWDDAEAHTRFRALCAALGRLPEAGRRYRGVRDGADDPARREEAARQIDALLATAMRTLEATREPAPDTRGARRTLFLVATGLTLALVVGALFLWLR